MNLIKDGKVDVKALSDFTYNANIEQAIYELNEMFSHYGTFYVSTVRDIKYRLCGSYSRDRYLDFLETFTYARWSSITPSMRQTMGLAIVDCLKHPAIAYDLDANQFIDVRLEGNSEPISKFTAIAGPESVDVVPTLISKKDKLVSLIKKVFTSKKSS